MSNRRWLVKPMGMKVAGCLNSSRFEIKMPDFPEKFSSYEKGAGGTLSRGAGIEFGGHPDRVEGLVYLDAMYPYAFDNGKGPTMKEFLDISGPQPPPPGESDSASVSALQKYYMRVLGFTFPEGELRQQWISTPDGRVGKRRDFPGNAILSAIITTGMKKYTDIPVPALVILVNPHSQGIWVDKSTDPKVSEAAKAYFAALL
jgi:hypothetical protein